MLDLGMSSFGPVPSFVLRQQVSSAQRLRSVATAGRTHAVWHQTVVRLSDIRRPECRLCEALQ